jgi:hypothetical protein
MSHRFIPQTSLISMGATFPKNILARKLEAREILVVSAYRRKYFFRNLRICGPVNRWTLEMSSYRVRDVLLTQ